MLRHAYSVLQSVGLFISIIGVIFGIWWVFQGPEIKIEYETIDFLQRKTLAPGLNIRIDYKGNQIEKIRIVKLEISNSGWRTILAEGPQKNIIGDSVRIWTRPGNSFLGAKVVVNDFDGQVAVGNEIISINFRQWRVGERVTLLAYISSDNKITTNESLVEIRERDLVNGDIKLGVSPGRSSRLEMFVPAPLIYVVGVVAPTFLLALAAFLAFLLVYGWQEYIDRRKWAAEHSESFDAYVINIKEIEGSQQKKIIKKPTLLPQHLWRDFSGPKAPAEPLFDNLWGGAGFSIFMVLSVLSLIWGAISPI